MARPPREISDKARELWQRGDEAGAEKASGLKSRQLRNRLGAPGQGSAPVATAASASGQAIATPAGSQGPAKGHPVAPPQGGPAAPPPDRLLQDVREILGLRNPAALEELEEGLVLRARDEGAYRAWLTRPFPTATSLPTDPRAMAQEILAEVAADYRRAPILRRGPLAEKVVGAIRELRQYFPPPPPPRPRDELVEELRRLDGEVLARLEEHQANPITIAEVAA